jgi:riboflavin synthase
MFTGLVESLGLVIAAIPEPPGLRLAVEAPEVAADARLGDSVCTNGCCLSAVRIDGDRLEFQLGPETLARPPVRRSTWNGRCGSRTVSAATS